MGRIQGLVETPALTGSQIVKATEGYVFSITLAWTGATAGDKVYLRDGLDGTAQAKVVFALPAAAGTYAREWSNGKKFDTGIFYDEGAASNVFTELTYK